MPAVATVQILAAERPRVSAPKAFVHQSGFIQI
jgi:hypothetical protein